MCILQTKGLREKLFLIRLLLLFFFFVDQQLYLL